MNLAGTPISGDTEESAKGFAVYTDLVARITCFDIVDAHVKKLHYSASNYTDLIQKAATALRGIL